MRYDVFLSHNSHDKPTVERLAARLEDAYGLAPFLDKWHLIPGAPWQEALEKALDESATCAVFLGPTGLGTWENEEMRAALDFRLRNRSFRVVPVLLPGADPKDPGTLPRFLQRLTWVDFRAGVEDKEALRRLVAGIRGEAPGREVPTPGESVHERWSLARSWAHLRGRTPRALLLALPTFLTLGAALILTGWRVPTRIRADLTVTRVVFTLGGNDWFPVLNSVSASSITAQEFAHITFRPHGLEVADPGQYDVATDGYPQSAWRSIRIPVDVEIRAEDEALHPAVTFATRERAVGTVQTVTARPGSRVTAEVTPSGGILTLGIAGQPSRVALSLREPFEVMATHTRLGWKDAPSFPEDSLTYRARPGSDPTVEIVGRPDRLTLVLTMPPQNGGGFASGIRVAGLDFTRQDHTGARVSSLVGSGSLDYPDYHGVKGATFQAPDTLDLVPTRELRIEEFALASDGKGLRLRLDGIAGRAATGSTDFTRDHRLSVFEHLWHGRRAVVMFGSGTFVVAFTLLAYHVHRGSGRTPR